MNILDELAEINPEALILEGYDQAIIGYVGNINNNPVVLYDTDKIIEILVTEDGMTEEEALDWYYYNIEIEGSYLGENAPMFATLKKEQI